MIYLMEVAASNAIQHALPEGWVTVGVEVNIRHLAATPIGRTVVARAKVTGVTERLVSFQVEAHDYPEENPLGDVIALRDKVAGAYDHVTDQISGLEVAYQDLSGRLYEEVKQAALGGTSLGEIVQAWSAISEDPAFVKAAFDQFVSRLFQEGIFSTLDAMGESLMKTAGARYVNPEQTVTL